MERSVSWTVFGIGKLPDAIFVLSRIIVIFTLHKVIEVKIDLILAFSFKMSHEL